MMGKKERNFSRLPRDASLEDLYVDATEVDANASLDSPPLAP